MVPSSSRAEKDLHSVTAVGGMLQSQFQVGAAIWRMMSAMREPRRRLCPFPHLLRYFLQLGTELIGGLRPTPFQPAR
jgi:hypothetical protein